jgi:hypothetical protein
MQSRNFYRFSQFSGSILAVAIPFFVLNVVRSVEGFYLESVAAPHIEDAPAARTSNGTSDNLCKKLITTLD